MISLSTVVWKWIRAIRALPQTVRVGQVPIVSDGDLAARAIYGQWLRVAYMRRPGGGVARMADGDLAGEIGRVSPLNTCDTTPFPVV